MTTGPPLWVLPKELGGAMGETVPWALPKDAGPAGIRVGIGLDPPGGGHGAGTVGVGPPAESPRHTLHRTLAPLLLVAQVFAGLPVQGVGAASVRALRFRWASARAIYCAAATAASVFMAACNAVRLVRAGPSFPGSAGTVFCATHVAAGLLQLRLARAWPGLLRRWAATEAALDQRHGAPPSMPRAPRALAAALLAAGAVEHALSYARDVRRLRDCPGGWRALALRRFAPLALLEPPEAATAASTLPGAPLGLAAAALALLVLLENFSWAFVDALIIALSVALASRFKQINARLRALRARPVPQEEWRALREDYNSLSYLTRTLDGAISQLVLLSFGNNLYFICLQLLQSMKPAEGPEGGMASAYFYWSFGFLLLKTSGVALCAADVHEQARGPRHLLYDVPPESYCIEVQRFLTQVATDDVALTGLNFFAVTRTLLLTIAGTIVTYEIVLVQFSSLGDGDAARNASSAPPALCDGSLAA